MQVKVGERIRSFREKQELSIADVADRTGLSQDFLQAVENRDLYPSLGPLLKIARALGVRLGTFMDDQVSSDPLIVRLQDRREELTTHSGDNCEGSVRFFSLGKGKSDRHMEPFFIRLEPGTEEEDARLSSHEGEEFIVVVSGKLDVVYGKESSVLSPGDSVYFNSVVPHSVHASGQEPCEIYAVLYFPE